MPAQRVAPTRDDARAAFETAVMLNVNQAVVAERVDARGTNPGTQFQFALGFANVVIDCDVAFGINLVCVDSEFAFDVDGHCNLLLSANHHNGQERIQRT